MLLFLFFFIYAAAGTPATRLIYKLSADMMAGVESDPFDHFITGTIILNTLAMCVEYHNQASVQLTQFCKDSVLSVLQPESMTQVMTMLNYIFTGIFAIEAFLKVQQRLQLNSLH